MTEADYQRLVRLRDMATMPLRVALSILAGAAIVLGATAVLTIRALTSHKD
jgi:hypothetical protein